jgi:hypothetical protein
MQTLFHFCAALMKQGADAGLARWSPRLLFSGVLPLPA